MADEPRILSVVMKQAPGPHPPPGPTVPHTSAVIPSSDAQSAIGVTADFVEPRAYRFDPFVQLGRSGLKQYGGFIFEDFLPQLRGKQAAEVYKEILENSALVGGILRLLDLSIRQVERFCEPFSEDAEDVERAERVEQGLDDMSDSWEDTLSEIATMLPYGYAPMELIYKKCGGWGDDPQTRSRYDDGLIMWRKIALRAQDTTFRWEFDADGGVRAMIQLPPPDYIMRTIPIEKLLLFRPRVEKGNPEGASVLRQAYFSWTIVKRLMEYEAIAGERHAVGIPVVEVPAQLLSANATPAETSALNYYKKLVVNLRMDEQAGVVLPQVFDPETKQPVVKLSLLGEKAGSAATYDYDKIITRYETRIAMAMISDVAMLGHEKAGSWALARDKRGMLQSAIGAWLDSIYGVLNRHALPRLFALNGWPMDRLCKFGHGAVEGQALDELANVVQKLAQAGMALFPDDVLENHIRAEVGWPEKPVNDGVEGVDYGETPLPLEPDSTAGRAEALTPGGAGPGAAPAGGAKPFGKRRLFGKARHTIRTRRGAFQQRSGDQLSALELLRNRQTVGQGDQVAHGLSYADAPYDVRRTWKDEIEQAKVERVPFKGLLATQHTVRRDGVRNFVDNPGIVRNGQRNLSGVLEDKPVVMRVGGTNYLHDGHHRAAAKIMLGYPDMMARVVELEPHVVPQGMVVPDSPGFPANQGTPWQTGKPPAAGEPVLVELSKVPDKEKQEPTAQAVHVDRPLAEEEARKTPPWKVVQNGEKWNVVAVEGGKVFGTHDSKADAEAHMRALYANVPDARKREGDTVNVTVNVPDFKMPGPQVIEVHVPEVKVPAAEVTVNVPETSVTVNIPEQAAPSVTVEVPQQLPPTITVQPPDVYMPEPVETVQEIERDAEGRIKRITKRPKED